MFSDPTKNLKQLRIREDMIVADLGAGIGFYSVAVAKMVPSGKVYAIEVQKDFLTTIRNGIKEIHLNNIECLPGDVEKVGGTGLKDGIVDVVIASDILFQVEKKEKFIQEIKRILKPGGRVLLIDWSDASYVSGPYLEKTVPKSFALEMFREMGFIWQRDIDAGAHHYGMILERPALLAGQIK